MPNAGHFWNERHGVTWPLWSQQLSLLVLTCETTKFDRLPKAETIYPIINSWIHLCLSSFPNIWPNCSFVHGHQSFIFCCGRIFFLCLSLFCMVLGLDEIKYKNSPLICHNVSKNPIFTRVLIRKRRLSFSEEVKDESRSYWEDLHFLMIPLFYWLLQPWEGGFTGLQFVAVC